jgi:hypothetical protein
VLSLIIIVKWGDGDDNDTGRMVDGLMMGDGGYLPTYLSSYQEHEGVGD